MTALPTATPREARARLYRLLRDRRGPVVLLLILTALSTAASVAGPALIGLVVDAALEHRSTETVYRAAAVYAALALASAAVRFVAELRAADVGESALAELREEVFTHALGLSTEDLERAGSGDLISRVTDDTTVLARAVRYTVPRVVFASAEVVLLLVALAIVDPRLAAVALIAGAPVGAGTSATHRCGTGANAKRTPGCPARCCSWSAAARRWSPTGPPTGSVSAPP